MSKKKRNRQKRVMSTKKTSKNNVQKRGLKKAILKWILERVKGVINGMVEDGIKWVVIYYVLKRILE